MLLYLEATDNSYFFVCAYMHPGPGLQNDMLGDYHGTPAVHITFGDGLRAFESTHAVNITTLPGCDVNSPDSSRISAVVEAAKTADVVVLFLGLDGSIENEGQDRPIDVGLGLPGQQETLLSSVAAGLGPKTKLAMVLVAGGPVDITAARDNPRVQVSGWTSCLLHLVRIRIR
jgi:hypothetical protein